jgi:hypothetical protein
VRSERLDRSTGRNSSCVEFPGSVTQPNTKDLGYLFPVRWRKAFIKRHGFLAFSPAGAVFVRVPVAAREANPAAGLFHQCRSDQRLIESFPGSHPRLLRRLDWSGRTGSSTWNGRGRFSCRGRRRRCRCGSGFCRRRGSRRRRRQYGSGDSPGSASCGRHRGSWCRGNNGIFAGCGCAGRGWRFQSRCGGGAGNRRRSGGGRCGCGRDVFQPTQNVRIGGVIAAVQQGEKQRQRKEDAAQPAGDRREDIRCLGAEKILGHAAAERCAEPFVLRSLHEHDQHHEDRNDHIGREENINQDLHGVRGMRRKGWALYNGCAPDARTAMPELDTQKENAASTW